MKAGSSISDCKLLKSLNVGAIYSGRGFKSAASSVPSMSSLCFAIVSNTSIIGRRTSYGAAILKTANKMPIISDLTASTVPKIKLFCIFGESVWKSVKYTFPSCPINNGVVPK